MKLFFVTCLLPVLSYAFLPSTIVLHKLSKSLYGKTTLQTNNEEEENDHNDISSFRRTVLKSGILIGGYTFLEMIFTAASTKATTTSSSFITMGKANAVERAVGSAEKECQEAGNCLERGDWDAAVGWNWGGKDRCDATDPQCGPNGLIVDSNRSISSSFAVPTTMTTRDIRMTHILELTLMIGRSEIGTLRIGLYGDVSPNAVQQLVDFVSPWA